MPILVICPVCSKTVSVERQPRVTCPDCGSQLGFAELQRKHLIIDGKTEAAELDAAKGYFRNADFESAHKHFQLALDANGNSYAAQYFVMLCDIYLHEQEGSSYDVMSAVVQMIREVLVKLSRANISVSDKLTFVTAMLSETKVIITRRLTDRDDLFKNDIEEYRRITISDLNNLLELFKIEREQIMSFSRDVSNVLAEIVDFSIKACYKAVQTVMVDNKLYTPSDADYKALSSLCNELCFFGHTFDPYFDTKTYAPDFTQNYKYNDKVLARLKRFDESNKAHAKKNVIGDITEYESILAECVNALKFTYLSCYRSMCSRQVAQHARLFFNGFEMIYRLLMPRVALRDKKQIEIRTYKFAETVERCDMLTRFLVDAYELNETIGLDLHEYYEKLYYIVTSYYLPEIDKLAKAKDRNNLYYLQLLFECACSCAPALRKYVDFTADVDKTRLKLVKICKSATEDFLLRSGMSIDEIEQSNFYRPILQISNAVIDEEE